MSTVFTVISRNAIRDIHGLILDVKSKTPNMVYEFGDDESKYKFGFNPDVFAWVHQKSTRYLDWSSELKNNDKWHYDIRIPICSNCITWQLAFALIGKIIINTEGLVYTEEMDEDEDNGWNIDEFNKWKFAFPCEKKLEEEIELTIEISEHEGDVTIFGTYTPFTFNKNINEELKTKKSLTKEFEKRMLQLQNACLDDAYMRAGDILITSKKDIQYKAKICSNIPFTLIINDELDLIAFSESGKDDVFLVPSKKVREIMPTHCFFDEYSFYVDNASFANWDTIMEKARALHEDV